MKKKHLKTRKWYTTSVKPDRHINLIIMTDMGYIFEAVYEDNKFLVSNVVNHKVNFEECIEQDSITRWMKV